MEIKALIIDDEAKLREVLQIKILKHCPNINILGSAKNVNEAELKIKEFNPDLIFLDIQMPEETGFDLLNRFQEIPFEIIFVTGYNEFALKALKVSAVDYILKPVQTEDLTVAVEKATSRIKEKEKVQRYDVLKYNLENEDANETKIVIPGAKYYQYVSVNEIIHCEGWQKYTKIHLQNADTILSSYNIGIFRDLLNEHSFFAPHKSHLINMNHITKYAKEGIIILSNGTEVPVSRRRKSDFIEALRWNN